MRLLLVGGGGHCVSVLDVIREMDCFEDIGIIDSEQRVGEFVNGVKIIGCDENLPEYVYSGYSHAFVTVGSIGLPFVRRKIFRSLKELGFKIPIIKSRTSIVSPNVIIGEGSFIGKGTIINCNSKIGCNCIINTGAIIEHDCDIGDDVHIAPGATLSGNVHVEGFSHIGTNATVIQSVRIGKGTLVGAGSVVVKNFSGKGYGNPCREV